MRFGVRYRSGMTSILMALVNDKTRKAQGEEKSRSAKSKAKEFMH